MRICTGPIGLEQAKQNRLLQEKENEITELKYEMEKLKIEGTNKLEIEKQKELEKIVTKRMRREQESHIKKIEHELKLIESNPEALKIVNPTLYAEIKKAELGQVNTDALLDIIKPIVNMFKK